MLLFVYFENSSSVYYIVVIFAPYQILILCRPHHNENAHYSRTFRNRPHKMPRVSVRLRKVVAYESCIVGGLLRGEGPTHLLLERMYCIQFRGYDICKRHVVSKSPSHSCTMSTVVHTANTNIRPLYQLENYSTVILKSDGGRFREVVVVGSNYKALTGKILVFWISGHFWGYPVTSPPMKSPTRNIYLNTYRKDKSLNSFTLDLQWNLRR